MTEEYMREYRKKWLQERLDKAKFILGGQCINCGSIENLEFHHKDPSNKSFAITSYISRSWLVILEELSKCHLLCSFCHKREHSAKHGSPGMYRHQKCRCEICVEGNRRYQREWKRNKKRALEAEAVEAPDL